MFGQSRAKTTKSIKGAWQQAFFAERMAKAVVLGDTQEIKALIARGADPNHVMTKVVEGKAESGNAIISYHFRTGAGYARYAAAFSIKDDTFACLVQNGMDANQTENDDGWNAFGDLRRMKAARIKAVAAAGADINFIRLTSGEPRAHYLQFITIHAGNFMMPQVEREAKFEALIECGMNFNARNKDGDTVAHILARSPGIGIGLGAKTIAEENREHLIQLIERGLIDISIRNNSGKTARDVALVANNSDTAAMLAQQEERNEEQRRRQTRDSVSAGLTAAQAEELSTAEITVNFNRRRLRVDTGPEDAATPAPKTTPSPTAG